MPTASLRRGEVMGERIAHEGRTRFVGRVPYHLGYGITHPIALEGALKLKEITRLADHCVRANVHDYLVIPEADRFLSPILLTLPAQLISCHTNFPERVQLAGMPTWARPAIRSA